MLERAFSFALRDKVPEERMRDEPSGVGELS